MVAKSETARAPSGLALERAQEAAAMRVTMLLENQSYPYDPRVRAEAEALARAGYEVTVIAPRAEGQRRHEELRGVIVRRFTHREAHGGPVSFMWEYAIAHVQLFRLGAMALLRGADVLHIHNPPDTLFPLALLARVLGRRVVFDQHDLFPELVAARLGKRPLVERVAMGAQRAALRFATLVIATNESQRELSLERGRRRPEDVVVVRTGPPRAIVCDNATQRAGVLDEPRLIYVGELAVQDGVLALPGLLRRPELAHARLTLVGDGECLPGIEGELERDPALAERVTLTGRVPPERVPELLAKADIAVDPAPCTPLNNHSTMIKIAEYLAAGLPVVAYGLEETRRTAGDAALYAECSDEDGFAASIGRLAADPELRRRLAAEANRRAPSLCWENSEPVLLDAYGRLALRV